MFCRCTDVENILLYLSFSILYYAIKNTVAFVLISNCPLLTNNYIKVLLIFYFCILFLYPESLLNSLVIFCGFFIRLCRLFYIDNIVCK